MANPWDNDPIVAGPSSGGNPWDNDPIVKAGAGSRTPNPTDGMSTAERYFAGFGKQLSDWWRGAKQLNAGDAAVSPEAGIATDATTVDQSATRSALNAEEQDARQRDAPLKATTAGKLGAMTAQAVPFVVAPEGYAGAAAAGALEGALQPTQGSESRLANTALGAGAGMVGQAAGSVLGRVVQPIRSGLDSARFAAVQTLKDAGVPLDLSQGTGSQLAAWLKNAASALQSKLTPVQQQAYNSAVLRTFGETGTKASADVMHSAATRIGGVFDDTAARNPLTVDNKLLDSLADTGTRADMELASSEAAPIRAQIANIINKAATPGNKLEGSAYQAIRQSLDRLSGNTNQSVGDFARDIRSSLDDALERQAAPQDLQALQTARQQYKAMKQTQQAIQRGTDDVDPSALARAIDTNRNAGQSVYGRGDQTLVQLANAGEMILGKGTAAAAGSAGKSAATVAGLAIGGAGSDALYRLATGRPVSPTEMLGVAAVAGFGPAGARAVIESAAGRGWLQRWASSRIASQAAGAAQQGGRALVGGGAAQTALAPQQPPAGMPPSQAQ